MSSTVPENRQWQGTTYGNGWMHSSLVKVIKVLGLRLLYIFSLLFVVPVVFVVNPARRHIYRLMRRRLGYNVAKAVWKTYLNYCNFSKAVLDKFAMYAGKTFKLEIEGYQNFLDVAEKPEGFVQLSAHIGNYEIAGYTLVAKHKKFNAVVFAGEKGSVMASRSKMFRGTNVTMIPAGQGSDYIFEISSALERGETVSIAADRVNGTPRTVTCEFLGALAKFPAGPFSVAAMRSLDVIYVSVLKTSIRKYKVSVAPLSYDKEAPRARQVEQLCRAYAARLQEEVRQNPCQWYNYFDFWADGN